ncbi:hypothetical protein BGZ79_005292 [Entomortierella chlamydospora]|nr:hypothetical protein BGZ79_005292 [Entomortierella chlamydospora]
MEPIKFFTFKSPIDIPEIGALVASYLSLDDAVACSLVCKAWSENFMSRIWHTVDFDSYNFEDVTHDVISRHGKHIRVVKYLSQCWKAVLLQDPCVKNLISIDVGIKSPELRLYGTDLIRRNRDTITELELDGTDLLTRTDYDCAGALIPSSGGASCLVKLVLRGLSMTQYSFSTLLSICPMLKSVALDECVFFESRGATLFRHPNVEILDASIPQLFEERYPSSSLLVHFPNLRKWETANLGRDMSDKAESIQKDISKCCPGIVSIRFACSTETTIQGVLSVTSQPLEGIEIYSGMITPRVIGGILFHKGTLLRLQAEVYGMEEWNNYDDILDTEDLNALNWMLQLIPMTCSHLQVLSLPLVEMDMDVVERMPWTCMDLKELYIRVQGLDNKESILAVVKRWRLVQKERMKVAAVATSDSTAAIEAGNTAAEIWDPALIESRVMRHLLQFKKLTTLWLGYKTWRV